MITMTMVSCLTYFMKSMAFWEKSSILRSKKLLKFLAKHYLLR
jgi:hypothetical protein